LYADQDPASSKIRLYIFIYEKNFPSWFGSAFRIRIRFRNTASTFEVWKNLFPTCENTVP
jgi:hypothetical protein